MELPSLFSHYKGNHFSGYIQIFLVNKFKNKKVFSLENINTNNLVMPRVFITFVVGLPGSDSGPGSEALYTSISLKMLNLKINFKKVW